MSFIGLIFRTERVSVGVPAATPGDQLALVTFDATLRHSHRATSEVTSLPVEGGARIADHTRRLPLEVEIEGTISDTPITFGPRVAVELARRALSSADTLQSVGRQAWDELIRLKDSGTLVTVHTRQRDYENMLVVEVSADFATGTGRVYPLRVALREVEIVSTEVSAVDPELLRGKKRQAVGTKAAKPPPVSAQRSSAMADCLAAEGAGAEALCLLKMAKGEGEFASSR